MGKIVCATRGGEAAYRTQDAAIALAREGGDSLIFVFVADTHFLDLTERAVAPDVVGEEIARMGEFLLTMAQERAQSQGVEASYVVRRGEFLPELKAVATEEGARLVILGRPGQGESLYQLDELKDLARQIEEDIGIEARIV